MAIVGGITARCKFDLVRGRIDLLGDDLKIALYGPNADLSPATVAYTSAGEIDVGSYAAGGNNFSFFQAVPDYTNNLVYLRAGGVLFSGIAGAEVRGALVYNTSNANSSILVIDLGETKTVSSNLRIIFSAVSSPENSPFVLF